LQLLQVADQVANCEIGRVALAIIPELFASLEVGNHGGRDVLTLVAAAVEDGLDHLLVFPGQPPEEDGHVIAFRTGERALNWFFELAPARQTGRPTETRPFGIDAGLNLYFEVGLDNLVQHYGHGGSPVLRACFPVEVRQKDVGADYICPDIPWNPCASCLKKYLMTR